MIIIKKTFFKSTFILFLVACVLHFIYELSNKFLLIGFISPINESIFEHTKLIFFPLLVFYLSYYLVNKSKLDINKYFTSTILSLLLGIILVPMIYYGYSGGFGSSILAVDILITYIVFLITNIFFYTNYNFYNISIKKEISIIFIILICIFYGYATINKIDFPIFN